MSIGKSGKHAQQMGQTKRQRHSVQTGEGSASTLRPPQRRRPTPAPPEVAQRQPEPMVQREEEAPAAINASTPQSANPSVQNDGGHASTDELAEKVYELMKKDLRIQRERFGKMRR